MHVIFLLIVVMPFQGGLANTKERMKRQLGNVSPTIIMKQIRKDQTLENTCKGQSGGEYIAASNINQFENCTIVNGNLKIVEASFAGDTQYKIPGVTVADLQILKSVQEVTGYIMIQSNDTNFRNLSFLSNLEVIHGREVDAG